MRDLLEVRAVPVEMKGGTVWVRTDIEENAAKMFRAAHDFNCENSPWQPAGRPGLLKENIAL